MDATELRIGNWIDCFGYCEVSKILKNKIEVRRETSLGYLVEKAPINSINVKPIELTEEILLKCGFKYLGNGFYESSFSNISIFSLSGIKINIGFKGVIIGEIKHLHQLQNLHFALTNQELNINI